jgi:hypothetical protein
MTVSDRHDPDLAGHHIRIDKPARRSAVSLVRQRSDLLWPPLVLAAVPLWVWGVVDSKLVISDLGIISSFPLPFWISIALMVTGYVGLVSSRHIKQEYLGVIFIVLLLSLWLIPTLLGASQPVAAHIWGKNGGFIASLLESGNLSPRTAWYHNWPGVWIIVASIRQVSGISVTPGELTLHPFTPFFIQSLYFLMLYALFLQLFGMAERRWIWLSLLVFLGANWHSQNYLSPQAYGMALIIPIVCLMAKQATEVAHHRRVLYSIPALIMTAGVIVTHLPSTLILLAFIVTFFVGSHMMGRRVQPLQAITVILAVAVMVIWNLQWASIWVATRLPGVVEAAFDLKEIFQIGIASRVGGDFSHSSIAQYRLYYSALWIVISMVGVAIALVDRQRRPRWICLLVLISLTIGSGVVVLGIGGSLWEMVQRSLFLVTISMAFFAVYLFRHAFTSLIGTALLILAPLAILLTHYGDQRSDYLSPDYMEGARFFHSRAFPGSVTEGERFHGTFGKLAPPGVYQRRPIEAAIASTDSVVEDLRVGDDYVVLTDATYQRTRFTGRHLSEYEEVSQQVTNGRWYNHVYSSPTVDIYRKSEGLIG